MKRLKFLKHIILPIIIFIFLMELPNTLINFMTQNGALDLLLNPKEINQKYKRYNQEYYLNLINSDKIMDYDKFKELETVIEIDLKNSYEKLSQSDEWKFIIAKEIRFKLIKWRKAKIVSFWFIQTSIIVLLLSIYFLLIYFFIMKFERRIRFILRYKRLKGFKKYSEKYRRKIINNRAKVKKIVQIIRYTFLLIPAAYFIFYTISILLPFFQQIITSTYFDINLISFSIFILASILFYTGIYFLFRIIFKEIKLKKSFAVLHSLILLSLTVFVSGMIFFKSRLDIITTWDNELKKEERQIEEFYKNQENTEKSEL